MAKQSEILLKLLFFLQINALKKQGIYEKSVIIFTSKHGNSPIDHATLVRVDSSVRSVPVCHVMCRMLPTCPRSCRSGLKDCISTVAALCVVTGLPGGPDYFHIVRLIFDTVKWLSS